MGTREPRAMEEIHEIRIKLFEEERKMSPQQKIAFANKVTEDFVKRYRLQNRIAKSAFFSQ